jgi:hypothetical protein
VNFCFYWWAANKTGYYGVGGVYIWTWEENQNQKMLVLKNVFGAMKT